MADVDDQRDATLAEFAALRDEIGYRTRSQQLLINLNLLVPATIAAAVLRDAKSSDLLLLIPAVSVPLGLFFADHAVTIRLIGKYIKDVLSTDGEGALRLGWEQWSTEGVRKLPWFRRYEWPLGFVFLFPAGIALWVWRAADPPTVNPDFSFFWWLGASTTFFMTLIVITTNLKPFPYRRWRGSASDPE